MCLSMCIGAQMPWSTCGGIAKVEQGDPHVPIGDYLNIMNALIGLDKTGRKTEFDAWSLLSSGDPLR